jgi:hypothetical protein
MWCIFRDGVLYEVHTTKKRAMQIVESYRPGSKHKWLVEKYDISISLPRTKK